MNSSGQGQAKSILRAGPRASPTIKYGVAVMLLPGFRSGLHWRRGGMHCAAHGWETGRVWVWRGVRRRMDGWRGRGSNCAAGVGGRTDEGAEGSEASGLGLVGEPALMPAALRPESQQWSKTVCKSKELPCRDSKPQIGRAHV